MKQAPEFVIIIILNLNKREDTLKCLESVFKLDYSHYEVVVVDKGQFDQPKFVPSCAGFAFLIKKEVLC